jgi:hypothetical protein
MQWQLLKGKNIPYSGYNERMKKRVKMQIKLEKNKVKEKQLKIIFTLEENLKKLKESIEKIFRSRSTSK